MGRIRRLISRSADETFAIGRQIGESLSVPCVIAFFGDLAAGKTTLIKGLALGAAHIDPACIQSPTFTYLNIYEGKTIVYHFDLYRLRNEEDFLSMGFDEYFETDGICCIEWSERIRSYLPSHSLQISLTHTQEDERLITVQ